MKRPIHFLTGGSIPCGIHRHRTWTALHTTSDLDLVTCVKCLNILKTGNANGGRQGKNPKSKAKGAPKPEEAWPRK